MDIPGHYIPSIDEGTQIISKNYSELFPNKIIPKPTQGDNRERNVNYSDSLPPAFVQNPLGSCVATALSAIKEYQEYIETGRKELVWGNNGKSELKVVKKSIHYLYDQRGKETHCELYEAISDTFTNEQVTIKGKTMHADVTDILIKPTNQKGCKDILLIQNSKHANLLTIGGETFEVVDDSAKFYFSRFAEKGTHLRDDDTKLIQSIDEFQIHQYDKNDFQFNGPTWDDDEGFGRIQVERKNAIKGELAKSYNQGEVLYFTKSTLDPRTRIEIEMTSQDQIEWFKVIKRANDARDIKVKCTNNGFRLLSQYAKFEYMKIKVARKFKTFKKVAKGTKILMFQTGWYTDRALDKVSSIGIVDEIFWKYRRDKIWEGKVKPIPQELIHLGKSQTVELIGGVVSAATGKINEYRGYLKLSTVEAMIHALEHHGPCPIVLNVYQYKIHNLDENGKPYGDHGHDYCDRMRFWKKSTDPKHKQEKSTRHAVVLVGFDYSINQDGSLDGHFLLRNSWGSRAGSPYKLKGTVGDLVKQKFGDLRGHTLISFSDWHHVKYAYVTKDNINNLKYAPDFDQLDFYYDIFRNYYNVFSESSLPEDIPSEEVFILAIRGWEHDRPAPQYKSNYSDTIIILYNNDFWGMNNNKSTFLASTVPNLKSFNSKKGTRVIKPGVYNYQFNKANSPTHLTPSKAVQVQYYDGTEDYEKGKTFSDSHMIICGGEEKENDLNGQTLRPRENPSGNQLIFNKSTSIYDGSANSKPFEIFMNLVTTHHTKKQTIPLMELSPIQARMFTQNELNDFVEQKLESIQIPADIKFVLIESEDLIDYVENKEPGGGD